MALSSLPHLPSGHHPDSPRGQFRDLHQATTAAQDTLTAAIPQEALRQAAIPPAADGAEATMTADIQAVPVRQVPPKGPLTTDRLPQGHTTADHLSPEVHQGLRSQAAVRGHSPEDRHIAAGHHEADRKSVV